MLQNIDWDSLEDEEAEEDENDVGEEEDELNFNDDPIDIEGGEDLEIDEQVEQMHLLALETRTPETSMQSFARLTNDQAWVPFRKMQASAPKTDLDMEEEGLFNKLHLDCKRNVPPGTPRHGCRDFELSWNVEVAERYRKKMEDDSEDIVLINRKSYIQLQEHCDDIVESDRMSKICDPNCPQMMQLNETFRRTRQEVAAPTGRAAETVQHRNTGLPTPFGAPTRFNPELAQHAVIRNNALQQTAPWSLAAPPLPGKEKNALHNFKHRTWCLACGFRKKEHLQEESFGSKCKRNHCSNCMQLQCHHPNGMGPRCTNERKSTSPHLHWCG